MKTKPLNRLYLLTALILTLTSCIGITADIQMRGNGSGKLTLEYRFSRMAEAIGRLDGNERWQIIPIGRADWERTAERIDGLQLVSFSSREDKQDVVNKVTLEFKNTEALRQFLDPSGKRAVLDRRGNSNSLNIILNEPVPSEINKDLMELIQKVSAGYKFKLSFSANGNSAMALTDGEGSTITPPASAKVVSSGKKVSLEIDTADIVSRQDGLGVSFDW